MCIANLTSTKMAKNRGDLMVKITDMLVDVGMALSRVEVLVKLYPTTRMVELTAKLYAAFLEFLEEVIALFQRSAVRRYLLCHGSRTHG